MTRDEATKIANKTARSKGAVGGDPVCYQYVRGNMSIPRFRSGRVLDYGAGPTAPHAQRLREEGFEKVVAYEVGDNFDAATHTKEPEEKSFDLVIVSNVLNAIPDFDMLVDTIKEILSYAKEDGVILFNYPRSPRKLDLSMQQINTAFLVLSGLRPHKIDGNIYALDMKGGEFSG